MTTAAWLRKFVKTHPAYGNDSVVSDEIAYDLVVSCQEIGLVRLFCFPCERRKKFLSCCCCCYYVAHVNFRGAEPETSHADAVEADASHKRGQIILVIMG